MHAILILLTLSLQTLLKHAGVNATLVPLNFLLAWVLTELGIHYLVATVAGFVLQITLAFFINRRWTFQRPHVRAWGGLLRASIVEFTALIVVLITAASAVELLQLDYLWARALAVLTSGAWCYVLDSLYTFRDSRT